MTSAILLANHYDNFSKYGQTDLVGVTQPWAGAQGSLVEHEQYPHTNNRSLSWRLAAPGWGHKYPLRQPRLTVARETMATYADVQRQMTIARSKDPNRDSLILAVLDVCTEVLEVLAVLEEALAAVLADEKSVRSMKRRVWSELIRNNSTDFCDWLVADWL
ncbi:hypothetical protein T12_14764 [Trichinella patagoniensis]|uniref:Uncharacterized protein n=1 Tax=Trichinella patagoniensis TaxID=990121 RepID=A0A0V0Z8V3_9BILA|nr:hypothetical protein T12_14764 [Trichinella patagoniensis]